MWKCWSRLLPLIQRIGKVGFIPIPGDVYNSITFMLSSKVLTAIRWTAGVRMVSQAFTWATTLVVIRLLTPADYGLLAISTIFLSLLAMLADAGIGPVLVQKHELNQRELRQAFGMILVLHLVLAIGLLASAAYIAHFFEEPRLTAIVCVVAAQLFINAFIIIPNALLQRALEFRKRSLLDLGSTVLGSLATLLLAIGQLGVWALIFGSIISQVVRTVGTNVLARSRVKPEFRFTEMRSLVFSGGQVTLSQIIWSIHVQADAFIAGKWLGKEALGHYSVAMHLASLPNQRISGLINQVAFPAFSRIQNDLTKVADASMRGVRILCLVAFPILWGISSVAPEIVTGLLGSKWIDAILPLQILALVMPLRIVSTFLSNPVQALGRFDVALWNVMVSFVVMVIAFAVGVQFGLVGLCLAWLTCMPIVFLVNMRRYMRALGTSLRALLASMTAPAVATLAMYAIVEICRATVFTSTNELVRLVVLVFAGAFTYGIVTVVLNRKGLTEAVEVFRAIAGRGIHRAV
jgi:teichuronic acid exporter